MSAEPGQVFEKRFPNRLEDLGQATAEAVRFLKERGVGERAVYVANLTIEEMASNIVKYGYDDTAPHEIRLRLEIEPGALLLALEDDGHEFNPLEAPEPDVHRPTHQREPGGLGIHLVRRLVHQMQYQRCKGRNHLRVRIRLT